MDAVFNRRRPQQNATEFKKARKSEGIKDQIEGESHRSQQEEAFAE